MRIVKEDAVSVFRDSQTHSVIQECFYRKSDTKEIDIDDAVSKWIAEYLVATCDGKCTLLIDWRNNKVKLFSEYLKEKKL